MRQLGNKKLVLRVQYDEDGEEGFGLSEPTLSVPGDDANCLHLVSFNAMYHELARREQPTKSAISEVQHRTQVLAAQNARLSWTVCVLALIVMVLVLVEVL